MTDNDIVTGSDIDVTTETVEEVAVEAAPRQPVFIDRPIQTVGRCKEAAVRAWFPAPASSTWTAALWRPTSPTRCTSVIGRRW